MDSRVAVDVSRAEELRDHSLMAYGLAGGWQDDLNDELGAIADLIRAETGSDQVQVSIIEGDRQVGLLGLGLPPMIIPRSESLCDHAMWSADEDGLFETSDARMEPAFAGNPWVDGRHAAVRFYAAAPITGREGVPLGTVCCFSFEPGALTALERQRLRHLADLAVETLELRRQLTGGTH